MDRLLKLHTVDIQHLKTKLASAQEERDMFEVELKTTKQRIFHLDSDVTSAKLAHEQDKQLLQKQHNAKKAKYKDMIKQLERKACYTFYWLL